MATVIVYSYTVFDQGKLIRLPSKRAADQIAQIGGQVIWETAQAVDESALRDDAICRNTPRSRMRARKRRSSQSSARAGPKS